MRSCSTFRRAALAAALLLACPIVASAQDSSPADCSAAAIPDAPFAGWIDGSAFAITDAEIRPNGMTGINGVDYDAYQLILGTSGMSDVRAEIWVSVIVQVGTQPDGRTFRMLPQDSVTGQPEAGPGAPEVQGWYLTSEPLGIDASFVFDVASLRLELGERADGLLPGRLYFCAPDIRQSEFAGSFDAAIGE
jgi:hypothetical protein